MNIDPETYASPVFSALASAFGVALGEISLAIGTPNDLDQAIREAYLAAQATRLASDLAHPSKSLAGTALDVVRAWHEDARDLDSLGQAIAKLQEVLGAYGLRYVAPGEEEE